MARTFAWRTRSPRPRTRASTTAAASDGSRTWGRPTAPISTAVRSRRPSVCPQATPSGSATANTATRSSRVALRIVEQAGRTDVGRQRSANEDSLVVRPPLFAVADGMGGARAGEVASAVAVEADEARRGMGTTLTLAKLHGDEVSLAHVGDSRAYRLRAGELEQLTRDHSLVAELERSGQITPEAAEHHPQRSIITRALGPEPDVEVDTYTLAGRAGDLFLICSDGLTSMIADDEVTSILRGSDNLEEAAEALIRAANQSGG